MSRKEMASRQVLLATQVCKRLSTGGRRALADSLFALLYLLVVAPPSLLVPVLAMKMFYLSSIAIATAYPSANHPYNIRTDGLSPHTTFDDLQQAQRTTLNAPPIEQLRKELDLAVQKHSAFWNVSLSVAVHGGGSNTEMWNYGPDVESRLNNTNNLRLQSWRPPGWCNGTPT